jgi:hypothetical protein
MSLFLRILPPSPRPISSTQCFAHPPVSPLFPHADISRLMAGVPDVMLGRGASGPYRALLDVGANAAECQSLVVQAYCAVYRVARVSPLEDA